jgi:hypothetical protein
VPHFEKMLYDNAQLLSVYSKAYSRFKTPLFNDIVVKIINWLERDMLDKSGMFYAALDADSEGEEGKYYVWTAEEVRALLGSDYEIARQVYHIDGSGTWEHGTSILLRKENNEQLATQLSLSPTVLEEKILQINETLLTARIKRVLPGLDDKCLTSWNAMMVTGLCDAYKSTKVESYKELATRCLNTIIQHQITSENVWHTFKNGKPTIQGMLDDYAFLGEACISAFEISGHEKYLHTAKELTTRAIDKFYDLEKAMFYFNEKNELILQTAEIHDNVIPASNSAMAHLLIHIGLLFGNSSYIELAENLIGKVQKDISSYPSSYSNWARALQKLTFPFYEIAIVGEDSENMAKQLRSTDIPHVLVIFSTIESAIPIFKDRFTKGQTNIYICQKGICKLPVKTIQEALKIIRN